MDALLGNYLSLGDMINVHMCGDQKDLSLKKSREYLGLTITDNGNGRAFVKKIQSEDGSIEKLIEPGDHIAAINSESTVGMRHDEVARTIRELPLDVNFTMQLISPKRPESLSDLKRLNELGNQISLLDISRQEQHDTRYDTIDSLTSTYEDLINSSLPIDRLLSKTTTSPTQKTSDSNIAIQDSYKFTIEKINSILESFLGINDNLLAIRIYRLAKESQNSFDRFRDAMGSSELSEFDFNEEMKTLLWNCASSSVA